jgi:spore germination cell wall hydrolase CwlJ-like protein
MLESTYLTAKTIMMSMMLSSGVELTEQNVEQTYCMSLNIYYEARGEGWKGKAAVAHVVKNRVKHPKYPNTICGVVLEAKRWKGKPIREMCQFAWYCDGKTDTPQMRYKAEPRKGKAIKPNITDWEHSVETAIQVTDGWSRDVTKGATHYYNYNISTPSWSTVYPESAVIGNHRFLIRND